MNNPAASDQPEKPDCITSPMMYFGQRPLRRSVVYAFLFLHTALLFILFSYLGTSNQATKTPTIVSTKKSAEPAPVLKGKGATAGLITKLKYYGLWNLPDQGEIPRFFIKSFPADLHTVKDISVRKKVFLHSLLPHALYVRQQTLHKRSKLQSILGKLDNCDVQSLDFVSGLEYEHQCLWTSFLTPDETEFIHNLSIEYRTTTAQLLLRRVNAVPTSIILAQGALESSWGSSRFSRKGNSIFGMWTWKTAGIVPSRRDEGKTHKVKIYDSVLQSVQAYHLTLNRLEPYKEFRQLRLFTDDPLILAEGLMFYSERGYDYVQEIKKVILSNDLKKYDRYILNDLELPEFTETISGEIESAGFDKASL